MPTIKRFEDLEIWKLSREITKDIRELTLKNPFRKDFVLVDQIKKASGSVMDNIAEGYERDGSKEFRQFLFISKGSIGEVRSQLYRALDFEYITNKEFDFLYRKVIDLSIKIQNLITYIKKSGFIGNKIVS